MSCDRPPPALILKSKGGPASLRVLFNEPNGVDKDAIEGTEGGSDIERRL
jgi:hypothetical protein